MATKRNPPTLTSIQLSLPVPYFKSSSHFLIICLLVFSIHIMMVCLISQTALLTLSTTSVRHFKLYEMFCSYFKIILCTPFYPSPAPHSSHPRLFFQLTDPSSQTQNDDPFPSHIVNVFSFAHLPFSFVQFETRAESYKIYFYQFIHYITFRKKKLFLGTQAMLGEDGGKALRKVSS